MSDAARQTVLGAIRHHLRQAALVAPLPPDHHTLGAAPCSPAIDDPEERVQRFVEKLSVVGGRAWRTTGVAGAADAVRQICAESGVGTLASSDGVLTQSVRSALRFDGGFVAPTDRDGLFHADAGLCDAQCGIAETGTLVLTADVERHRLVSLLPPLCITLLRTDRLLGTMAEALADVHRSGLAPTITFVTGPSRTADIELRLVVGVHGPRHLHVVLVDGVR